MQKQNLFVKRVLVEQFTEMEVFIKNYNGEVADMITVGLFTGYVMSTLDWYIYFAEKKLGKNLTLI